MRRAIVSLGGLIVWLAGAGLVALTLTSETFETNWPIVYAILGVGALLYALLWTGLENLIRQQKRHHARVERMLAAIAQRLKSP